jgi:hypothetical protein
MLPIIEVTYVYNVTVVMGDCANIGFGGFVLGGGLGTFSSSRGFASDSLMEVELVVANGTVLKASEDKHQVQCTARGHVPEVCLPLDGTTFQRAYDVPCCQMSCKAEGSWPQSQYSVASASILTSRHTGPGHTVGNARLWRRYAGCGHIHDCPDRHRCRRAADAEV